MDAWIVISELVRNFGLIGVAVAGLILGGMRVVAANRQAQAAFRERRTEYIRQLETTIKRNEESLQSLQQSHRSAADECLMLRYKNSLLERILLEKGSFFIFSPCSSRFYSNFHFNQALMFKPSYG